VSEGRNDHYVPKLLLKRFAHDPRGVQLHRLHVTDGRVGKAQVRTEARRKHLDTFTALGEDDQRAVAQMFRSIESAAGKTVDRVCDPTWDFNDEDRIHLAWFVAAQHVRVPRRIAWQQGAGNIIARLLAEQRLSDPTRFLDTTSRLAAKAKAEQQRLLEQLRTGELIVEMDEFQARGMAIATLPNIAMAILNELQWSIVRPSPGLHFVLGDDPLTMFDSTPKAPGAAAGFLSSPASQTALPLSPYACLLMTPGPPNLTQGIATTHEIDELNLRSLAWAVSGVYATRSDTLMRLHRLGNQRRDHLKRLRPVPPQMFILDTPSTGRQGTLTRLGADGSSNELRVAARSA
jgi:hypothetical protein